jgi:putative transposase
LGNSVTQHGAGPNGGSGLKADRRPKKNECRLYAVRYLNFLSDTFGACRKFRIMTVNDDCCRKDLALIADISISGTRVARELDARVRVYGKLTCIVSDNGAEFTSKATLRWANENGVAWHFFAPGNTQQNGYSENSNGSLRDECLNEEMFDSTADARLSLAL